MIDHVLNRDGVLGMAQQLIDAAQRAESYGPNDGPRLQEGINALKQAVADQPPLGEAVDPESLKEFLPSDPTLSLMQAMYEQALDQDPEDILRGFDDHPSGPLATKQLSSWGEAEGWGDFGSWDPKFVTGFLKALAEHLDARIAFQLPASPPRPCKLDDDARVVLVGDWGTGGAIADEVAERIHDELVGAGDRQTHVVHLGDVYYAGTRWEAEHRFLPHWPVRPDEARHHHSWCLNANHDMYAAGEGLFDVILADPRFGKQLTEDGQASSQFHLLGDRWQILGLDSAWKLTGYGIDDLKGHAGYFGIQQRDWLADVAGSKSTSTVLLTHHPPFTREHAGSDGVATAGNLLEQTSFVRGGSGLAAWFWGHEHRCLTYGSREGVGYAACIGHGAIPSAARPSLVEPPEWELTATWEEDDGDEWRRSGFAVLDLAPEMATVRYIDHLGQNSKPPDTIHRT